MSSARGAKSLWLRLDSGVKVREIVKLVEADGWVQIKQVGSHRQFIHAIKPGKVTIAGKPGQDMPKGTARNILKQAGLKGRKR